MGRIGTVDAVRILAAVVVMAGSMALPVRAQDAMDLPHVWGVLWYLRSTQEYDNVSFVYGGVDGSAALVYRDAPRKRSFWHFLEKEYMWVGPTKGGLDYELTAERGGLIESVNKVVKKPTASDKRWLSYWIADVYYESKLSGVGPYRHVPFLEGLGWPGGGATVDEAKSLCASMNIVLKYPDGAPGSARVQKILDRIPGDSLPPTGSQSIEVELNWDPYSEPPPLGTEPDKPILVPLTGGTVTGIMTPWHRDIVRSGASTDGKSDLFFELPANSAETEISVRTTGAANRVVLSAWTRVNVGSKPALVTANGAPAVVDGYQPTLVFDAPATECFVVVEFPSRNVGEVRINISW